MPKLPEQDSGQWDKVEVYCQGKIARVLDNCYQVVLVIDSCTGKGWRITQRVIPGVACEFELISLSATKVCNGGIRLSYVGATILKTKYK